MAGCSRSEFHKGSHQDLFGRKGTGFSGYSMNSRITVIMRVIFLLILISSLCGCSGTTPKEDYVLYPWKAKKREILRWATSEKTKVDGGKIDNSKYWEEFYRRSIELRPDLDDFLYYSTEMIKVSRIFEEGKITKKQFEDKERQLRALFAKEEKRRTQICDTPPAFPFMAIYDYETRLFACYRGSLLIDYVNNLRTQLSAAGSQFSVSRCAFFGDSIHCTTDNPPFFY